MAPDLQVFHYTQLPGAGLPPRGQRLCGCLSSRSGAGVWLSPGPSRVLLVLGGHLRPHGPDAQRSAVEPGVKPAVPRPSPTRAGCLGVRCGPDWFSSAETSFSSSCRHCSFAGSPPQSHALGQLLALPLASLALWGPGAGSLVRATLDRSASSLQVP